MNYINLINGFWVVSEEEDLTATDQSTYFAILKYCNSLNWLNPFVCHWEILIQYSKTSKNSFYNSLDKLSSVGLIRFEKGQRNSKKKPKVFVLEMKNNKGTIKEQQGNNKGTTGEQQGNLYKLLNKETIKLINSNADLINKQLKGWIDSESNKHPSKEKLFSVEVHNCFDSVLGYFDEPTDSQKKNWLDTIDKLNRLDGYDFATIQHVTKVAREDDFWNSRFMSLSKLRDKDRHGTKYIQRFIAEFKTKIQKNEQQSIDQQTLEAIKAKYPNL